MCADVLCTVLNSKFTHRPYMNDRVRASRVHAKKARSCTSIEGRAIVYGRLICKVPVNGCP